MPITVQGGVEGGKSESAGNDHGSGVADSRPAAAEVVSNREFVPCSCRVKSHFQRICNSWILRCAVVAELADALA